MPRIGVGYASAPVAVSLVEDSEVEEDVVQQEEEKAPLKERDVKPLEPPCAEFPRFVGIACREEIACRDKEERHVESVYYPRQEVGGFGMAYHHQDDGQTLAD